ncbi:hypothetical protein IAU60_002602 [Kwoniella sp. DSM 27419]
MGQSYSTPRRDHNGPLFGGHHHGDFSIRRQPVDVNKPLPLTTKTKSVKFGHNPPAWVFYKARPADENLGNTRYCAPPPATLHHQQQRTTPPPSYGTWDDKALYVRNQ